MPICCDISVKVDTGEKTVDVGSLEVDNADVKYEHPSEKDAKKYSKEHPMPKDASKDNSGDDKPWKVKADKVRLNNSKGKYSQTGKKPNKPGTTLDPDNIEVEDVNAAIDNFEMDGDNIKVPVKHLSGKERSGLQVKDASGTVNKNKNGLDLDDVKLKTKGSDIKLNGHVDQDMLDGKPNGKATIDTDSKIDLNEVEKLVPEARRTSRTTSPSRSRPRPVETASALTSTRWMPIFPAWAASRARAPSTIPPTWTA